MPATRPASSSSAPPPTPCAAGQQGGGAQSRHRSRRAGRAGHRSAARRHGRSCALADEIGYPVMLKAAGAAVGAACASSHAEDLVREGAEAKREARPPSARRGLSGKAGRARPPCRGADPRRHPWQRRASVRARLHRAAPQPEGRRARARPYLDAEAQRRNSAATLKIANAVGYVGAGTVEFLMDADTGAFYFIEVNPRIQVEHTVTEEVTGIDIVKAQIHIARRRCHRLAGLGRPHPGRHQAARPRHAVPHHHRGSRPELHPRLWPHHRLSRRDRLRHPA
jgi:hypothetical protein